MSILRLVSRLPCGLKSARLLQDPFAISGLRVQAPVSGLPVGILDRQTYQGGTRGSRFCGEDCDRETENSKVCARTRDTRFIQVRAAKMANPTSCLGDQVWRPALGVG
jgi:hypothetical protein